MYEAYVILPLIFIVFWLLVVVDKNKTTYLEIHFSFFHFLNLVILVVVIFDPFIPTPANYFYTNTYFIFL